MTPFFDSGDGRVVLYCGDCLEIMPQLEAGSVDAVVTDPPYGMNLVQKDRFDDSPDYWLSTVPRVVDTWVSTDLPVVIFGAAPQLARDVVAFTRIPDRILIWAPRFNMSHAQSNGIFYRWHPIYCWNLPLGPHGGPGRDVLDYSTTGHNWWNHPGTKPVKVMQPLVSFAAVGATVLDPFMGSGTTGVACVKTGRRFIGLEISEEYCEIAVKRIKEVLAQPKLLEMDS